MKEKEFQVNKIMDEYNSGPNNIYMGSEPMEEIGENPFSLDMEIVSAILLIQKNERGRQGRNRITQINMQHIAKVLADNTKRMVREGKLPEANS